MNEQKYDLFFRESFDYFGILNFAEIQFWGICITKNKIVIWNNEFIKKIWIYYCSYLVLYA